jgi:hypothetical protein
MWIPLPIHWHIEWWELMMWSSIFWPRGCLRELHIRSWPQGLAFLFVCLDINILDVMWGFDFNIVLAVDVRVMNLALIGVLPLGTHIIFLLLPTTLLACRLILLNDVGTSSFGLVFWPVSLLTATLGNNSFSNSCPLVLAHELLSADCYCFLSFSNIGFSSCASRLKPSFKFAFCLTR